MKAIHIIITFLIILLSGIVAKAQNASDSVRILYKDKSVTVKPSVNDSTSIVRFKDDISGQNVLVKVSFLSDKEDVESRIEEQIDSAAKKIIDITKYKNNAKERRRFIQTNFLHTLDFGFASTYNESENNVTFTPKLNKSANISIGIINQNMNLYNNQLLLSYGFNYNGYYLKYRDKQVVQYLDNNGHLKSYKDSVNDYDKNRLDVRYFSVPVLLEYHTKNDNFSIAAGVEFGFNGHTKVKTKGDQNSKEFKQSNENDIKINPNQMNAVLRIGFDNIALYGKYSLTDMYESSAYATNENPHQHMFSFGICLFGI